MLKLYYAETSAETAKLNIEVGEVLVISLYKLAYPGKSLIVRIALVKAVIEFLEHLIDTIVGVVAISCVFSYRRDLGS